MDDCVGKSALFHHVDRMIIPNLLNTVRFSPVSYTHLLKRLPPGVSVPAISIMASGSAWTRCVTRKNWRAFWLRAKHLGNIGNDRNKRINMAFNNVYLSLIHI